MASSVTKVSSEDCACGSRTGIPQYWTEECDPSDLALRFRKVDVHRRRCVPQLSHAPVYVVIAG